MVHDSIWIGRAGSELDAHPDPSPTVSPGDAAVGAMPRAGRVAGGRRAAGRPALALVPRFAALLLALPVVAGGAPGIRFSEQARALGIDHRPTCGRTDGATLIESSGAGVALFDFDSDGDLDLLLLDGATLEGLQRGEAAPDRLYRNDGPRAAVRFVEVGGEAGLASPGWSQGVQVGDIDGDDDPDLYITRFGPDVLYRNEGDGTFTDVTVASGISADGWSTAVAFGDLDGDGDLDLYVARYLEFDPATAPRATAEGECIWRGLVVPCGPDDLEPLADLLYLNDGRGGFTEASEASGLLAAPPVPATDVRLVDIEGDGDLDVVVAGDGTANRLHVNDGSAHFTERALLAGIALDEIGRQQHTGSLAVIDWNDDQLPDLHATGDGGEGDILYESRGDGQLVPGMTAAHLAFLTRGARSVDARFADLDNDGDLDRLAIRGERIPEAGAAGTGTRFRQVDRLFETRDGMLEPILDTGTPMDEIAVSRGLAVGDLDGDADLDVVIARLREPPLVLLNELDASTDVAGAVLVRLRGPGAHGARVEATLADRRLTRYAATAGGRSQDDMRVHIGTGWADNLDLVRVIWADGHVDSLGSLPAGAEVTVRRGSGVVEQRWLGGGLR